MSKTFLNLTDIRKAMTFASGPSPEISEYVCMNQKPRLIVNIRKLKSEEVAKVATVLDFNEDYELCQAWFLYLNIYLTKYMEFGACLIWFQLKYFGELDRQCEQNEQIFAKVIFIGCC